MKYKILKHYIYLATKQMRQESYHRMRFVFFKDISKRAHDLLKDDYPEMIADEIYNTIGRNIDSLIKYQLTLDDIL